MSDSKHECLSVCLPSSIFVYVYGSGNLYKTLCIENECLCMCVSVDEIDCMAEFVHKKVVKKKITLDPYSDVCFHIRK